MADITAEGSIVTSSARAPRTIVFTSALVGYWFFFDSDDDFFYQKTTDGGATWSGAVEIDTDTTIVGIACDVWYDRWTPGDVGNKIHITWITSDDGDVSYRNLDTTTDTLSSQVTVFNGASAVAGRGSFVSITKARSGYIYCAFDIDAGAERGLHRSTDSGATFGADLDDTFVEATLDECFLFPASNTGDDNDIWSVYHDADANAITLKMWDSSAGVSAESSTIVTFLEGATDLTGQFGFSGSIRHNDGHLILAIVTERDSATGDHRVFDINGTGSIVELTAITTNIDDHYHPAVFIDQSTTYIYVFYNGKRDGSEVLGTTTKVYYTKSTDNGSTWSAGDTAYMEGATAAVAQVWAPLMGPRLYAGWRVGTTLIANAVNSVNLTPPLSDLTYDHRRKVRGPFPFPKSVPDFLPTVSMGGASLSGFEAVAAIGTLTLATSLALVNTDVLGTTGQGTVSAGNDTTIALSGVAGTTGQGSLTFAGLTFAISGSEATGSLGSVGTNQLFIERPRVVTGPFPFPKVAPSFAVSGTNPLLTGVEGVGSLGTLQLSHALTGSGGTTAQGTIVPGETFALTGQSATGSGGTLSTLSDDVAITGTSATTGQGSVGTNVIFIERPKIVTGPFPFPKAGRAFAADSIPITPTGVSGTGSVGTLTPGLAPALTGSSSTGSVGTLEVPGYGDAIGVSGTTQLGSVAIADVIALVGHQPTGAAGTVGLEDGPTLTSVTGTGSVGSLGLSDSPTLSGVSTAATGVGNLVAGTPGLAFPNGVVGTGGTGTLTTAFTFALVGQEATGSVGTIRGSRLVVDRPHYISGPFPFLRGGMFQFYERGRLVNPAAQPITITLSGVSAALAQNTFTLSSTGTPTGKVGTTSLGTPVALLAPALSGQSITGAVGSVTLANVEPITGQSVTGSLGTLTAADSVAISGETATGSVGTFGLAQGLTGQSVTGSLGTLTPSDTVSLTGAQTTTAISSLTAQADGDSTVGLVGRSATGSLGTLAISDQCALSGQSTTGSIGNLSTPGGASLSGFTATSAAGTVTPEFALGISGLSSSGSVGSVGLGQPITGVVATGQITAPTISIEIAETGLAASTALANVGTESSQGTTVGVSGVESSIGQGTAFATITVSGTGLTIAGTSGSLGLSQTLSGVSGSGQIGSCAVTTIVALTGIEATGAVHSLVAQTNEDATVALSVVGLTGSLQSLTPDFAITDYDSTAVQGDTELGDVVSENDQELGSLGTITTLNSIGASTSGTAAITGVSTTAELGTADGLGGPVALGESGLGETGTLTPEHEITLLTGVEGSMGSGGSLSLDLGSVLDIVGEYKNIIDIVGELE